MNLSVYVSFNVLAIGADGQTVGYSRPLINLTHLIAALWPIKQRIDRGIVALTSSILSLSQGVTI